MATNKVVLQTGEVLIDLSNDTVEESAVLEGYKYHDKTGEQKTGACTYTVDASEANAKASEILEGVKAAVGKEIITGSMPNRGSVNGEISEKDGSFVISQGAHDGSGKVMIAEAERAKLIPGNIKQGVSILGVEGSHSGAEEIAVQAKEVSPSFTEQTVLPDEGVDYLSQVKVKAIAVTYTDNAAGGQTVTIG